MLGRAGRRGAGAEVTGMLRSSGAPWEGGPAPGRGRLPWDSLLWPCGGMGWLERGAQGVGDLGRGTLPASRRRPKPWSNGI